MLLSRMFALVPVVMMMATDGVDANADAFGDDYTVYNHALGLLEPGTPAAKKQKQLDQSTDDDGYDAYEIMDDGEGLHCYDMELDRPQNQPVEPAEDSVPDRALLFGMEELGEGGQDLLDLKPMVKDRRNTYILAEKMRYVELCEAAWRDDPNGPCLWIAVSGVPIKDQLPPPPPTTRATAASPFHAPPRCATLMRGRA